MYGFTRKVTSEEYTLHRDSKSYPGYTPETVCRYVVEDLLIQAEHGKENGRYFREMIPVCATWCCCVSRLNKSVMEDLVEDLKALIEDRSTDASLRDAGFMLLSNFLYQADSGCIGAAEIGIDLSINWLSTLPAYIGTKAVSFFFESLNKTYHSPSKKAWSKSFWMAPGDTPNGSGYREVNAATLPAYYALICESYGDDDYDDYLGAFSEYAAAAHGVTKVFADTLSTSRDTDRHGRTVKLIPEDSEELTFSETERELRRLSKESPYFCIRYQCLNTLALMAGTDREACEETERKIRLLKEVNPRFRRYWYGFDSEEEKKRAERASEGYGGFMKAERERRKRLFKAIAIPVVIALVIWILSFRSVRLALITVSIAILIGYGLSRTDMGFTASSDGFQPFFLWRND